RRTHAVFGCTTWMEALRHCAIDQESPHAAGKGTGNAQGGSETVRVEAHDTRRAGGRAEGSAGPGRVPAQIVVRPVAAGAQGHAGRDVIAGSERHQHAAPIGVNPFRHRANSWHDYGTRVAAAAEII